MSRSLNRLTVRQISTLKVTGRHADGGGLYLRITDMGSKSWVFMTTTSGKRTEIGLGPASTVSLAAARTLASKMRDALAIGEDPRSAIGKPIDDVQHVPTFGKFAEEYITSVEHGWRNHTHRQQWRNSLRDHAEKLMTKRLDEIGTDDVLKVLEPIWLTHAETAKRVRGRIERVLDVAKVRGHRPLDSINPATWRGHLALLLPSQANVARSHHAALPWQEAPTFMSTLRTREAVSARCLEFVILTAARSGEALGATWGEIDLNQNLWTIPGSRMKAGVEHCVPLSKSAAKMLNSLRPADAKPNHRLFEVQGVARSNMAMAMLLRRMKHAHITVHGFRSTFRDWAGDATNYPRELIEQALAHTIENAAERAYRRGTAIERRRALMQDWDDFLSMKETETLGVQEEN